MGLENRKGQQYFYRKVRCGARVRSEYAGSGGLAQLVDQLEAIQRDREEMQRALECAEIRRMQRADEVADELSQSVELLTNATLLASGFHRHKGTWRKKR